MKNLSSFMIGGILGFILFLLFIQIVQAQDLYGVSDIAWGMSPEQVQPGTPAGRAYLYEQQFLTYPAVGTYFFEDQRLVQVTISPRYTYQEPSEWTPEYNHIQQEFNHNYGDPVVSQNGFNQWENDRTQSTLMMFDNGWMVRFDSRGDE